MFVEIPPEFDIPEQPFQWMKLPDDDAAIMAVIFAFWDNVSGPRSDLVWRSDSINDTLLNNFAKFSLSGQMVTYDDSEERKHHFHLLNDFFTSSIVFKDFYEGGLTQFAISFIFRRECLDRYRFIKNMLNDDMDFLVDIYVGILQKKSSGQKNFFVEKLTREVDQVVNNINELLSFPVMSYFFNWTQYALEGNLYHKKVLKELLSSHLQTGSTVIIGKDRKIITCWMHTLVPFILGKDRNLIKCNIGDQYVPNIVLQGVLCDSITYDTLVKNRYPSTVLDVTQPTKITVRKTENYSEYYHIRSEERKNYIKSFLADEEHTISRELIECPPSPLISTIVDRIFIFEKHYRQSYIDHQVEALTKRAVLLINAIDDNQEEDMIQCLQRYLMLFGLDETAFHILLGIAEKLTPETAKKYTEAIYL
eukprot:TRINITY_DN3122_c0_g1_i4.p1 TRINITY_DN3122_c0_g1~~TRINITY_DN3122_c0_g1_i4.p1  ORF type:complete len:421 (-),score=64.56 TRINITY_DN3122_c0_g1_i4:37-1299(-)